MAHPAPPPRLKPTLTTWVSKDTHGEMVAVRVVDMDSSHLWRWIRYFRRKWREGGFAGSDAQVDAAIQQQIITAPAIYAEAAKRGVIDLPKPVALPLVPSVPKATRNDMIVAAAPGVRRITLDED